MKETREQWRKRMGLQADASKCQQVIKRQDTGRARQVQSSSKAAAPLDRSGQLAPIVIELDKNAAEMIIALREVFPYGEITIKKG